MRGNGKGCKALMTCVIFLMAGLTVSHSAAAETPGPVDEKSKLETYPRSRTRMMDVLLMELLKGGEINSVQARQVVNKEFSAVWNDKTPLSPLPDESKEDRSARFLTNVYLAAVKASFLDPENHGDGRNPRLKEDRWDSDL